jgi:hypothetical protein
VDSNNIYFPYTYRSFYKLSVAHVPLTGITTQPHFSISTVTISHSSETPVNIPLTFFSNNSFMTLESTTVGIGTGTTTPPTALLFVDPYTFETPLDTTLYINAVPGTQTNITINTTCFSRSNANTTFNLIVPIPGFLTLVPDMESLKTITADFNGDFDLYIGSEMFLELNQSSISTSYYFPDISTPFNLTFYKCEDPNCIACNHQPEN